MAAFASNGILRNELGGHGTIPVAAEFVFGARNYWFVFRATGSGLST